ncbi:hypothetical protein R3P38DRAFT_3465753 [Favolaschia claudopus]|uniref:Uncharacterized protein n=1 Tax=Favolaschia claudopus TaxID=2862362 RepID=A0AAV9ZFE0_9AGAR
MADEDENSAECNDCGQAFPLRQGTGLCPKCVKLQPLDLNSREYADIQKWPQCTVCGITRRNMVPASSDSIQTCGSTACLKAAVGEGPAPLGPSLAANAAFESNQRRVQLMRERLKKFGPQAKGAAGTTLTTASLQSHENGGGAPGEPKIWICWQVLFKVRLSSQPKAIAASLGYHAKGWAVSLFMPDIKAEIVKVINTEWCSLKGTPLLPPQRAGGRIDFSFLKTVPYCAGVAGIAYGTFTQTPQLAFTNTKRCCGQRPTPLPPQPPPQLPHKSRIQVILVGATTSCDPRLPSNTSSVVRTVSPYLVNLQLARSTKLFPPLVLSKFEVYYEGQMFAGSLRCVASGSSGVGFEVEVTP